MVAQTEVPDAGEGGLRRGPRAPAHQWAGRGGLEAADPRNLRYRNMDCLWLF